MHEYELSFTYFYEFISDIVLVQNRSKKYIYLKIPSTFAWRRRLGFGMMLARRGDSA